MVVASKAKVEGLVNIGGRTLKGNEYIGAVDDILAKNVTQAMEKLGANLVTELAKNSPADSGKLASSYSVIGVKETKIGYRLEIKVGVDYADFIDKGVKGVKNIRKTFPNAEGVHYKFKNYGMPTEALKSLAGWVKRKNFELEATSLIKNQKNADEIDLTTKTLAYFIKKNGIEGRQFIKKSIDDSTPSFNKDLKAIGTDTLILRIAK